MKLLYAAGSALLRAWLFLGAVEGVLLASLLVLVLLLFLLAIRRRRQLQRARPGAAGPQAPPAPGLGERIRELVRLVFQLVILDHFLLSPIRDLCSRKEPLVVFGPKPRAKKKKKVKPRPWWKFWQRKPREPQPTRSPWPLLLASGAGFLFAMLFLKLRGKNETQIRRF